MNRNSLFALLAVGLTLLAAGSAFGQSKIVIKDMRVGFPYGPQTDWYKAGTWVPVQVKIGPPVDRNTGSAVLSGTFTARLRVATNDGDGMRTFFSPLPISIRGEEISREQPDRTFISYIKIGAVTNEITAELLEPRLADRPITVPIFKYPTDLQVRNNGLPTHASLVATLGRPRGLDPRSDSDYERTDPRNYRLATLGQLEDLPEHWFAYGSVDVFVLPTGSTWAGSLAQALANDPVRRVALEQWVAQGGHLVVTVGSNVSIVANRQSFPLEPLLPAKIDPAGTVKSTRLEGLRAFLDQNVPGDLRLSGKEAIKAMTSEIANLTPIGASYPLISEQNGRIPLVVRGSYGLGLVTLVGFDVDREPFASWENQPEFWTALLDLKSQATAAQRGFGLGGNPYNRSGTISEQLGTELESFGDVTVISFFWVALFILGYVLLIGPVDYFFLKKVVKRLELTWITFPLTVLLVSLAAYLGAYWLKGDELRINKVDVVDLDQTHGFAVGTTWFSVFSPRLESFDFQVEPMGLGTARDGREISWFARDGFGFRGVERQSTDLFQREYELAEQGAAVRGVPIQVWAMKTFSSQWQTRLDGQLPILSTLRGANNLLSGTITSRLPGALNDAVLIYRGSVYRLGTVQPSEAVRVPVVNQTLGRQALLFGASEQLSDSGRPLANYANTVARLMFFRHFAQDASGETNQLLSYLDQTRRIQRDEAILVGIFEDRSGQTLEMNNSVQFGSRLESQQLRGTMRQATFVRVYLPVRTGEVRSDADSEASPAN